MIDVYTDGACSGTPGPGGWGWAIQGGAEACGFTASTTNQRMEMQAVIEALAWTQEFMPGVDVCIVTDSAYVSNCFRDKWYVKWQANGWRNGANKAVANQDLWERMIPLVLGRGVTFRHVRGHQGNVMNEYVDKLCVRAKLAGMGR